jgi:SAM-dependent methyltransferase
MPFEAYARYYDHFYADKDYAAEYDYIHGLIRQYAPRAETLLDLGCGSGAHALLLAGKGFKVKGIDQSREQLKLAMQKLSETSRGNREVEFLLGDIRHLHLKKTFDVVISLFHVMSYQTENSDLLAAFQTARNHLKAGGLFIFDAWYGPAVLSLRPETRVKQLETDGRTLIRIAQPEMKINYNRVDVHYDLLVNDRRNQQVETIRETHCMRYLFEPEVDLFLKISGFRLLSAQEWLTGQVLDTKTWSCCFIAQAVSREQVQE